MIERECAAKVLEYARQYPLMTITGPRQSDKDTVVRYLFQNNPCISLENIDERAFAHSSSPEQAFSHYLTGPLFENLIVAELLKRRFNAGKADNLEKLIGVITRYET